MAKMVTTSDVFDINKRTGALILGKNRLDDYATKFLNKYCRQALVEPMSLPVDDILADAKLTVKEVSLSANLDVFGCSAVFPSCLGKNALTLTVKYKRTDLKNYGNEVQINPGSNVCANNDLDPEYSCDVLYTLSDEFNTVTYSDFVSTAVYLMHFLHGGRTTSRSCS